MDVLLGPTFTLDVPSSPPPPYDADRPTSDAAPSYAFFPADSSDSSSSIGTPDHSDDDDDDDDENYAVSSKRNENEKHEKVHTKLKTLASLDSLEEALPVKKGLSNHFIGKSKSFSDLSHVNTIKELEKQENPFNKRRRILIASKLLTKKSSFYAWSNPKSMPLLPVHESEDDYDDEEEEEEVKVKVSPSSSSQVPMSYVSHMKHSLGSFKCRSLLDLKEHEEKEENKQGD